MEPNAVLVQQIYRLMEDCNRIYVKQKKQSYPLPAVTVVNSLNSDMLLSFRAYLIYLVKSLDPRYNLSNAGITISKGAKMYIPIASLPLKWPPKENKEDTDDNEDTKIAPSVPVLAKPKIE